MTETWKEWEGQIVAIHGANNSTLRMEYDPTYKHEKLAMSVIVVLLVTILIIFIEYKLIRRIRKESFNQN